MEVRHREFAHARIYRIAPAQHRMVRLAYRTPKAPASEQGDHMVRIRCRRLQVQEQGFLSVPGQDRSSEQRAFEAVRGTFSDSPSRREIGLSGKLEIYRQGVQVVLNPAGRRKLLEQPTLKGREERRHVSTMCHAPIIARATAPKKMRDRERVWSSAGN